MSQIKFANLSFCYAGSYDPVFTDINLTLDDNWRLGLVGRNGRGKTTLLRLLSGSLQGTGHIAASAQFCYFPAHIADSTQAVRRVLMDIAPSAEEWILLRELSLLGVSADALSRPYCTLSPGEQTKAQLAALFTRSDAFPLIDEPTNHLDTDGRRLLGRYLSQKRGFILVSHDRDLLDACTDHILSINKADITVQKGNFTTWHQTFIQQLAFERSQDKRLRQEIDHIAQAAQRTAAWSDQLEKTKYGTKNSGLRPDRGYIGHKSAKIMRRTKQAQRRQESAMAEKAAFLQNSHRVDALKIPVLTHHAPRLITLTDLAPCFGTKRVCAPVSLEICTGARIALTGGNGTGKSSLLRCLAQQKQDYTGALWHAPSLKISYAAQTTDDLIGDLRAYAALHQVDYSLLLTILRKLDFSRTQFEKDMKSFSAGQKKKVLLARSLCQPAHLYIWDEPLNFIDLDSRMQIESLIREFSPTMVFAEHDVAFSRSVATSSLNLTKP